MIARATSPQHIEILETERAAVRLGHNAFTRRMLDDDTISRAARVFRHFRDRMDRHQVTAYRAVATAAAREVRNYRKLMERIQRKSGIELEVISSEEEARLVCSAVRWALGDRIQPRVIFDLGGGSLEMNFLRARRSWSERVALPLGTIRLMETYSIDGAIDEDRARRLRQHILALLQSAMPSPPKLSRAIAVACGGNAEALVRLAPGPMVGRTPAINVRLLQGPDLADAAPRRARAHARVSRAQGPRRSDRHRRESLSRTVAKWLGLRSMLVPGVGVREGLLLDLVAEQYSAGKASAEEKGRAEELLAGARWFAQPPQLRPAARRAGLAPRAFAFRSAAPDPRDGAGSRGWCWKSRAMLHDVGHFVNRKSHNRHGEYLIRNSEIPGLARLAARHGRRRWCATTTANPSRRSSTPPTPRSMARGGAQMRLLTSLLRIAEKLESEHAQRVAGVDVQIAGHRAIFLIRAAEGTRLDVAGLERKAELFEKEFHLKAEFRRAQRKEKVA